MELTVVQESETSQKPAQIHLFRWQKYADGDGRLWIISLLFGFGPDGRYGHRVELLNVDEEKTIEKARTTIEDWIRQGTLKRIDTPILL